MQTEEIAILISILRRGWDKKLIFNLDLEPSEVFEGCLEESHAPFCLNAGWSSLIYRVACNLGYRNKTDLPTEVFELIVEAEGLLSLLKSSDEIDMLPGHEELRDRIVDQIAGEENAYDMADAILETINEKFRLIPR